MEKSDICKLTVWNSRGLSASIPYLRTLLKACDILCLSEHWLFENNLYKLSDIALDINYVARSSKKSSAEAFGLRRGQGGVAIIWKKAMASVTPIDCIQHERICGVRLQNTCGQIVNILSVYLPARGCDGDLDECLDELGSIIEDMEEGSYTIVCGDLNGDIGSLGGPRSLKQPDNRGRQVFKFIEGYNMVAVNLQAFSSGPLNTFYGPNGESCLDYLLVPECMDKLVVKCKTLQKEALNTSDHVPVCADLDLGSLDLCASEISPPKKILWDKISAHDLFIKYTLPVGDKLAKLKDLIEEETPSILLIDGSFDTICNILKQGESCIPVSKFKRNLKPFWCADLSMLKKIKVECYKSWVHAGRPRGQHSVLWRKHSIAEKNFKKKLKLISRSYDNDKIREASRCAAGDKNIFWKLLKRNKNSKGAKVLAIKNKFGKVVYDVDSVLDTWRTHFSKLCTPVEHESYDQVHFAKVSENVSMWARQMEDDQFLLEPFSEKEIAVCIAQLNTKKAPGYDMVCTEHIRAAGQQLISILMILFNMIVRLEYIPCNFRRGIQIPLFKGKNLSSVDPNNYRGITLLSSFNKLFEMVIWKRLKGWWYEKQIISPLQGAARPGVSCLHTALLLQESISSNLEKYKKIFVSYYDVSKAFDGIWVDGLFYQLRQLGLGGKVWRLLYMTYQKFLCRVRIQGRMSDWYEMRCGIHQGGYLSLVKYVAFINSLIEELRLSKLCCTISNIETTPPRLC